MDSIEAKRAVRCGFDIQGRDFHRIHKGWVDITSDDLLKDRVSFDEFRIAPLCTVAERIIKGVFGHSVLAMYREWLNGSMSLTYCENGVRDVMTRASSLKDPYTYFVIKEKIERKPHGLMPVEEKLIEKVGKLRAYKLFQICKEQAMHFMFHIRQPQVSSSEIESIFDNIVLFPESTRLKASSTGAMAVKGVHGFMDDTTVSDMLIGIYSLLLSARLKEQPLDATVDTCLGVNHSVLNTPFDVQLFRYNPGKE